MLTAARYLTFLGLSCSYECSPVLLNLINSLRKSDKCYASLAFYLFSSTRLSNSINHENSWKILTICNKRSTHVRSSISATGGALMLDPLYLQQEEHSYKIFYICNKRGNHVRSSISATRRALM